MSSPSWPVRGNRARVRRSLVLSFSATDLALIAASSRCRVASDGATGAAPHCLDAASDALGPIADLDTPCTPTKQQRVETKLKQRHTMTLRGSG